MTAWRRQVRHLAHSLLDLALPPVCAGCRHVGQLFCDDCLDQVSWIEEPICQRCGRPQIHLTANCSSCHQLPPYLQQIRAATRHVEPVRTVLHKMKYEGLFALSQPLGELMVRAWPRWQLQFDLILPIPLHNKRLRERGYNQSELLVNVLKEHYEWSGDPSGLTRSRHTRPQLGLTANERRANVLRAFVADSTLVTDKRVLLVDDVCTTGSTLAAAAQALKQAGAHSVSAYCLTTADRGQDYTTV